MKLEYDWSLLEWVFIAILFAAFISAAGVYIGAALHDAFHIH